jgi:hypothetical protein
MYDAFLALDYSRLLAFSFLAGGLGLLGFGIFPLKVKLREINSHSIGSKMRFKFLHHGFANERTQVIFDHLGVRVDTIELEKLVSGPYLAKSIKLFLALVIFVDILRISHSDNAIQPFHALDGAARIQILILPKQTNFLSFFLVFFDGIHMKGYRCFRCVVIVSICKTSKPLEDFFPLKDCNK